MSHKFLVHARGDSVGVAIEEIQVGEKVEGVCLEEGSTIALEARQRIPLGHKIALIAIASGTSVVKYDQSIGEASKSIEPGQHVHTHNLKSARW